MIQRIFAGIIIIGFSILFLFYVNTSLTTLYSNRINLEENLYLNSTKYIVDTIKCQILNVDPFGLQAQRFFSREKYISCTNKQPLTYVKKNRNVTTLYINFEALSTYSKENISCCYSKIERRASSVLPDKVYMLSPCIWFYPNVTLNHDSVRVECTIITQHKSPVYENTHAQIIDKSEVREKLKVVPNKDAVFSLLFLGIDSVSRLSFIRNLPNSYKFLTDNKWISFKGYNKIADNTYPNVMAVLTGYNESDSSSKCRPTTPNGLNRCPMIWYDYQKLGYATAYAEDETQLSTFNLDKKGFLRPPTDYYFRAYFLASEDLEITHHAGMKYCTGPETSGERILNIAKDFSTTFINEPSFGLFWMNTFSHNKLNSVSMMDNKIRQFLQDITNEGVLENSLVIFLSDHGIRFGDFRQSAMGWLEERLPFFFLWLPHRFRRQFPDEYLNVKSNADHKLTNPYDLYMTLQHLLTLSGRNYTVKPSAACSRCKSLFTKINNDRSCEDAAIPQHWCTCTEFNAMDQNSNVVTKAALFVIQQLHNIIHVKKGSDICALYILEKIIAASVSKKDAHKHTSYILIVFETAPKAVFETTVSYNPNATQSFKLKGGISRIDKYEPHSRCARDSILKKFCYCKT